MQIAGYTLLKNHENYIDYVESLKDYHGNNFEEFHMFEPKHYPVLIREDVNHDSCSILNIYNIETIEQDDLKELYNKLHEIFGKES